MAYYWWPMTEFMTPTSCMKTIQIFVILLFPILLESLHYIFFC